jgi:hypothetical protein
MKRNLTTGPAEEFADAMKAATLLGIEDERKDPTPSDQEPSGRTGKELARLLCGSWMKGHHRPLRLAYTAGRWHARALVEVTRINEES